MPGHIPKANWHCRCSDSPGPAQRQKANSEVQLQTSNYVDFSAPVHVEGDTTARYPIQVQVHHLLGVVNRPRKRPEKYSKKDTLTIPLQQLFCQVALQPQSSDI